MLPNEKSLNVKYQKPIPYSSKDIAQVKVFFKTGSKFKIKVTRSKLLVKKNKGLIIRYLYVKYQNPISYGSKDIAKVKIFKTRSKFKIKVKSLRTK